MKQKSLHNLRRNSLGFILLIAVIMLTQTTSRNLQWTDNYCSQFDSTGACVSCSYRYFRNANTGWKCTQISDHCQTWSNSTGWCLSCYSGYGSPVNGVCSKTPVTQSPSNPIVGSGDLDPNCQCYNNDRVCKKCYNGYQLDTSSYKCLLIVVGTPPVNHCCKYGYSDTNGKWFTSWYQGCKKVCIQCQDGYYLDTENQCQELPENCADAERDGTCIQCDDGFILDPATHICVPDVGSGNDDNCDLYKYSDNNGKEFSKWFHGCRQVCIRCKDGFWLDKWNQCQQNPDNCAVAQDITGVCSQCNDGFELIDEECVAIVGGGDDNCQIYGYLDINNKVHRKWYHNCTKICIQCKQEFYLDTKHICQQLPQGCIQANPYGICLNCTDGYDLVGGKCIEIIVGGGDDLCKTYKYADSKGKWFNKWFHGCHQVCTQCIDGYYLDQENQCQQLPENCIDAYPNGTCITCEDKYELNQDFECVLVGSIDNCKTYNYTDRRGKWFAKWFKGCHQVCIQCNEGFWLDKWNKCQQNPENCAVAEDITGICQTCDDGFTLNDQNECIVVVGGEDDPCQQYSYTDVRGMKYSKWFRGCRQVCIRCKDGFWLDKWNKCQQNPDNCEVAQDITGICTTCDDGYTQDQNGQCVEIIVGGENDHCKRYSYGDRTGGWFLNWFKDCHKVCIKCQKGYHLTEQGKCIPCKPQPVGAAANPLCMQFNADGSCAACSYRSVFDRKGICCEINQQCLSYNKTTGKCTGCYHGYSLIDGDCVTQ